MVSSALPDLRYSQNFLRSRRLVDCLLDRSSIEPGDVVLEIGAGRGLITERLARRCREVIAVEKDPRFAQMLSRGFAGSPHVRICPADFLEFSLPGGPHKVFANIPFAITTPIVERLTTSPTPPLDAYLVVQREAAARFMGEPQGTLRAALLEPWFEPSITHRFRRTDFDPVPRVDIVMLRLRKRGPPLVEPNDARLYRDFVVSCFTTWRPCLRDTLEFLFGRRCGRSIADHSHMAADATPTRVGFEQWLALFDAFKGLAPRAVRHRVAHAERRLQTQQLSLQKIYRTRPSAR
jgi:23S rRNA (adenine-N6)-dimethyltransferase